MRTSIAFLVLSLAPLLIAQTTTRADPRAGIIEGVHSIAVPGIPGPLTVFGDASIIATADVDGVPAPVIAAATWGKGHLVALGHEGFFSTQSLQAADTARLLRQLIVFAATGRKDPNAPIRVAQYAKPTIDALAGDGIVVIRMEKWNAELTLDDVDVVICPAGAITGVDVRPLDDFVRSGGGVVSGVPGWGWLQTHPGQTLAADFAANELFAQAGIAWTDGMIDVPADKRLKIEDSIPKYLNATEALNALREAENSDGGKLSSKETGIAVAQLLRCLDSLPESYLRDDLKRELRADVMGLPVPSAEQPLSSDSGLKRLRFAAHMRGCIDAPLQNLRAERCAQVFPGEVRDRAPRIAREVTINAAVPGWHSTGLYAPPGERITVNLGTGSANLSGCQVRIGAHADRLWHLATWKRAPQIDRTFSVATSQLEIASGFGGLIYLVLPEGLEPKRFTMTIAGAVEAPLFVLGQTKPNDWRDRIRKSPAPWAELASDKIIITLPAESVRELDDPTDLLKFWDRVADACADLACMPRDRKRPERYVTDVQISAGYMHAGYPIMTQLDAAPRFVDLTSLQRDGEWGMFHEIGHNHQNRDWTFDGTGEVTVNLFTMYLLDTVCTNGGKMHKAMSPESRAAAEKKYKENGTKFEQWKREPFTALIMYKQLQEGFGWDAYKRVFAEYRVMKDEERPKTDDEKRDQWMVRFSRTVGRNLGPFFEYWGIPTSPDARRSVENLPVWMPPD